MDEFLSRSDTRLLDDHYSAMNYARFLRNNNLISEEELDRIALQSQYELNRCSHLHTSFPFEEQTPFSFNKITPREQVDRLYDKLKERNTRESV